MTTHSGKAFQLLPLALAVATTAVSADPPNKPIAKQKSVETNVLRVATLNMAHGRGLAREQLGHDRATYEGNIDKIADAVTAHTPDVLAVQEADAPSAWSGGFDHVARLADRARFGNVHHGLHFDAGVGPLRIAYGTALLSRLPFAHPESHPFKHGPLHRKGFVMTEIDFDGAALTVVSIHFHSGSREIRVQQAREVIDLLKDRTGGLIVMGDFNTTWADESDALRLIADGLQLTAFDPEGTDLNTFRSTNPHKRLDWILMSRDLEFVTYHVWPEQVSDHLGAEAVMRRKQ